MKEKKTDPEEIIVNHIKLTRGPVVALACALVIVGLLVYLTLTGERAAASEAGTAGEASSAQSTGMSQFYLTVSLLSGNQVLTACVPGYHMASLWEMADPSNLKYNAALGRTTADGGEGPAVDWEGWVRTGLNANSGTTPGMANCDAWSSGTGSGSIVLLYSDWSGDWEDVGVWTVGVRSCGATYGVWCIED